MDVRIELDPRDLRAVLRAAKAFEPRLATSLRAKLRLAGESTVRDMRAEIMSGGGGHAQFRRKAGGFSKPHGSANMRAALAAGTRVSILASATKQGILITTSPSRLPAGQQAMAKAWNKASFRHPVHGRSIWVQQSGRPYFGVVIAEHKESFALAVESALAATVREIQA